MTTLAAVITGLDPVIQSNSQELDARIKSGHDSAHIEHLTQKLRTGRPKQ